MWAPNTNYTFRTFKQENTADFLDIDVATDSRVARLVLVEDTVTNTAQSQNYKRGSLILMMFKDTEDVGEYKCHGVYDSVFDDLDTSLWIAHFSLASTGESYLFFVSEYDQAYSS